MTEIGGERFAGIRRGDGAAGYQQAAKCLVHTILHVARGMENTDVGAVLAELAESSPRQVGSASRAGRVRRFQKRAGPSAGISAGWLTACGRCHNKALSASRIVLYAPDQRHWPYPGVSGRMIGGGCWHSLGGTPMSMMQTLLRSSHFMVIDHVCKQPRVDCGHVPGGESARLIFTRRGSFAMHVDGRTYFARPGQALLLNKHVECRVSHPEAEGCDCCIDMSLDDAAIEMLGIADATVQPCQEFTHDLQFQKAHVAMLRGLQHGSDGVQDTEELLLDTVDHLLHAHAAIR
ncbi:AraC family ligand binding domain-containing protein, partial [Dyella silvatica]|uniref:AraC family ligand binding domain-containing protein n=1 Tax=Dyella silvatica TaxID=2992128 RepID=UPI00224F4550